MTRYEQLADAATKNSEAFWEDKKLCELCALRLGTTLKAYLEAPNDAVSFVVLDSNLRTTNEAHPHKVTLIRGADRRWHFCIQLHFKTNSSSAFSRVSIMFAIRRDGNGFRVVNEQEFHVKHEADDVTLGAIAANIFDGLAEDYAKPLDAPRPRIGF